MLQFQPAMENMDGNKIHYNCHELTHIPPGMFIYCQKVVQNSGVFYEPKCLQIAFIWDIDIHKYAKIDNVLNVFKLGPCFCFILSISMRNVCSLQPVFFIDASHNIIL